MNKNKIAKAILNDVYYKALGEVFKAKSGVVDEMVSALENYGISTKGMNDDKAILQSYNDMIKDIRHDALFKKNKK